MTKYFNSRLDTFEPIPAAEYYVLSNDTFMSGWGPAKGKTNTVVVPCPDYDTALKVQEYARSRSDQSRIRICSRPPRTRSHVVYSLVPDWAKLVSGKAARQ